MSSERIPCWPIFNKTPAATGAHRVHRARPLRHVRRVAATAVSKPAVVVWVCTAIGGGIWAGLPQQAGAIPERSRVEAPLPSINGALFGAPPGWEVIGPPVDVTPPPVEFPFNGPPLLLPDVPIAPEIIAPPIPAPIQHIPEPCSAWLLLTAAVVGAYVARRPN